MHTNDVVTDGGGDESKRAREGKAAEHRMRDFAMKRPMGKYSLALKFFDHQ